MIENAMRRPGIGRLRTLCALGCAMIAGLVLAALVGTAPAAANEDHNAWFRSVAPGATQSQQETGVPAAVTLAQAALESGFGEHAPGKNYFGIKCFDGKHGPNAIGCIKIKTKECDDDGNCKEIYDWFRKYASAEKSFKDHGDFLRNNERYDNAFQYTDDPDKFARTIADDGYATDPKYADKLINLMQEYNLYQYDTGGGGGGTPVAQPTKLAWSGDTHVANGTKATLAATLTSDGSPVADRKVTLVLGKGDAEQQCSAKTNDKGSASCAVSSVRQQLTSAATVPAAASFAGDDEFKKSAASATLQLQYETGRAYGVSLDAGLPDLSLRLTAQPDTGTVRTAEPTTKKARCTATLDLPIAHVGTVCPAVTTTATDVTASTTVADATLGLRNKPLVQISGVKAAAQATCSGTTGSATVQISVAGAPVDVSTAPNSTIDLGHGLQVIVDEQVPTDDGGLTVNAVHLTALNGAVDLVVGSAGATMHNCA